MPKSDPFLDALVDLFSPLGEIRWRKMFGGAGVYCDDRMFILVADETLYFKADAQNVAWYEQHGSEPFLYDDGVKPVAMSYWRGPAEILDDAELAMVWGTQGVEAAKRQKQRHGSKSVN